MNYLHDWDRTIPNLDIVQDYRSERKQIQACRGKDFPFNYGDVSVLDNSHLFLLIFVYQ